MMTNVMDKIETQTASLQRKVDALSGTHLTNTWSGSRSSVTVTGK